VPEQIESLRMLEFDKPRFVFKEAETVIVAFGTKYNWVLWDHRCHA